MIQKRISAGLIFIFVLLSFSAFPQSNTIRGFYLKNVNTWLGSASQEDAILNYAQGNGFNYIILYDLGSFHWNSTTDKNELSAFIEKARTQYGISEFGASGEIASFFNNYIVPFNTSRSNSNQKFNVFNYEFEWWVSSSISSLYCSKYLSPNGYDCDTAGAFAFAWNEFKQVDNLAASNGAISEYYLGWPNAGQMQQVASRADRILLHAYRSTDVDVYQYSKNRLINAASLNTNVTILPIFSSEPSFMGPWLGSHPITQPYQTYSGYYSNESGSWKQYINLQGYTWFHYSYMPQTTIAVATITTSGPTTFCTGGSVDLTANSGSQYLWSPGGETTRTITVSSSGSYTVRVTNSSGANATSTPVVVTVNSTLPTPTVNASGPTTFCPGGSVTLSSSSGGSYLWSNGATTQSITVSTAGSYHVTVTTGNCSATSANTNVTLTSGATTPIITASGSTNICPGTNVTLSSSQAAGYLWSTGATTQSISVGSSGNYWVRGYSGPGCYAQSAATVVTRLSAPSTPTITAGGSTVLSSSNPTVDLTSSIANSYLWNSGPTTRTITVSAPGSYTVSVTGSNGCSAVSAATTVTVNGCVPPPPPSVTLSGASIIVPGQSVTLTSSPSGGYLWSTGESTQSITVSSPGNYTVRGYISGNCYSTSAPVSISFVTPRTHIGFTTATVNAFTVYPNPGTSQLNFSFESSMAARVVFSIYTITGQEMARTIIESHEGINLFDLDVASFPRGFYIGYIRGNAEESAVRIALQ